VRRCVIVTALALTLAMGGCFILDLDYLIPLGLGELDVITHSVPFDEVLDDPELDPATQQKLLWVLQVRRFAGDRLGLNVGDCYSSYYDTGDGPVMYNVSAAEKYALVPVTWRFPIVGEVEYLGYFQLDRAREHQQRLGEQGLDTYLGRVIAYSTIGYLRDPLYSSVLEQDQPQLAETIIHELTHNTIYKASDTQFNESVAVFVGRQGTFDFIESEFGADCDLYEQFLAATADRDQVDQFMADLYADLREFYARDDLTDDEKIEQREQVFQAARTRFHDQVLPTINDRDRYGWLVDLPSNNAWVLMHYRYHKEPGLFEQVYQAAGCDLRAVIDIFARAIHADDSYQYLRDWLAGGQ